MVPPPRRAGRGLERRCRAALFADARAAGVGTRRQVRASIRRFLRRHRRNAVYLRGVLRALASTSGLAVALLGLGPSTARAATPSFFPYPGAENPFDGWRTQEGGRFAFGDLDGDGDSDVVIGSYRGTFDYLQNAGSPTSPTFRRPSAQESPVGGFDLGTYSAPALADLDDDGDLDLVAAAGDGSVHYFENTGTPTSPVLVERTGAENPFDEVTLGQQPTLALADLDADGDLDGASGQYDGTFVYLLNLGSPSAPDFVARTGPSSPLDGIDTGDYTSPAPTFGDLDGDGDLDLLTAAKYGAPRYFENTGDPQNPVFQDAGPDGNPFYGVDLGYYYASPTFADLDGDGDLDMVSNSEDAILYFENVGTAGSAAFTRRDGTGPLAGFDLGYRPSAAFGDVDGDGDLDVVAGRSDAGFAYLENLGSAETPAYVQRVGASNPLNGLTAGAFDSRPVLADLDGDGDLDMVSGSYGGAFFYFQNIGTPSSPDFVERVATNNPFDGFQVGAGYNISTPALADLDGDGDLDFVGAGSYDGFLYLENVGTAMSPVFEERSGAGDPLDGIDVDYERGAALADLDGDGDFDLLADNGSPTLTFVENTGGANAAVFTVRTGAANPFDGLLVGYSSWPALADLDDDGDFDLVTADYLGGFVGFQNEGTPSVPLFRPNPVGAGPLSRLDTGFRSRATLGDLDGDGDLDLVTGDYYDHPIYFENTGTTELPAFTQQSGAEDPTAGLTGSRGSLATLVDLDGDDDLDIVTAYGFQSGLLYVENTGTPTSPVFVERPGAGNPFAALLGSTTLPKTSFGDLDGDGDLDAVVGDYESFGAGVVGFTYLVNTGSPTSPEFGIVTGPASPFDGLGLSGSYVDPAPSLVDLDRDGDLDLVVGTSNGLLRYFENTGTPSQASFVERTESFENPFALFDLGADAAPAPAFVDLDGDGRPDLVAGNRDGRFRVFLPEPRPWLLEAAALAALRWLRRRRRASQER